MSLFASVMIRNSAHFMPRLSSRAMLHIKDQVFKTCTEVDLRLSFYLGASRAQYIAHYDG